MDLDLSGVFEKFEAIIRDADTVFQRVRETVGPLVTCKIGCSDCCHALFDLTLIEAMYLNHKFNTVLSDEDRKRILDRADVAERENYKIKKKAFQASKAGQDSNEILTEVGRKKIRCPLLSDGDECELYEYRPITCRLYGIPTSIGGEAHTCPKSGFVKGQSYPTVRLENIHARLFSLAKEFTDSIESKHVLMSDVLVPVPMALINVYDEEYLGLKK